MKITIELDNGQELIIEQKPVKFPIFDKELIIETIQYELGKLNAEMNGYLKETTSKDKKLLSNFIKGKLTAYKEISKILASI